MLNGMFSAPNETGNTFEGGGVGDGQGDDEFGNDGQFRFDDPDDPGLGSQQHLRNGRMLRDLGYLGTETHVGAAHGAKQMQSIFANSIPGVGAVLGGVDAVNGEDSITGEKLTYFQQGLGLLGAVPFVGSMFKSTGRVAKTGRAVDKVADAIGHAPNKAADALEEGLSIRRGVDIGIKRPPRHHIFPQEMRDFFKQRGFEDIDNYTIPLDEATHQAIHKWMGSGAWNDVMKSRILAEETRLGRMLAKREMLEIGARMRREAGLSHIKIIPFQD
jgi:hypothetical protein